MAVVRSRRGRREAWEMALDLPLGVALDLLRGVSRSRA